MTHPTGPWPITFEDVLSARDRIRPLLPPTPMRRYPALDREIGHGIACWIKHENFQPTGAFKVRNAISVLAALPGPDRRRGVIAATRGNHGLGLAWAGRRIGVPVVVCVPEGNNPEKNEAIRDLGAELIIEGNDYDDAVQVAERIRADRGLRMVHSTNDPQVIAGAATMALEMLEDQPDLDGFVISVGGGSQAVGTMTVAKTLRPQAVVHAVQAAGAPAIHDAWHAGGAVGARRAVTFADGLATRSTYEMTFPALRSGLAGFVTVTEAEIAEAVRLLTRTTHTLVEGAGAAGVAGLKRLASDLEGRRIGCVISGGNIDAATLGRVLSGDL